MRVQLTRQLAARNAGHRRRRAVRADRAARARLVMHLLEPQAPDSFAAWGFFNACFEQKEYMEPYVAEQIAREHARRTA